MRFRVAVIGAGPSGFYSAEQLLDAGFDVDLFDALATPFGLVRAGVAPDHPKIKSVIRVYEKTATKDGFRFFGGVELGRDISRDELLERYHAVVYAFGAATDNQLRVPGEELAGSHPATEFVAWYNGHPDHADRTFDLSVDRAVVIGNGNVALDVARMLVLGPDELGCTDTADHALDALHASGVREVVVLGRRGPAQAAFTTPELRELADIDRLDVVIDPAELELDPHSAAWLAAEAGNTVRRNVDVLRKYAEKPVAGRSHRMVFEFLRSPVEILGDEHGAVRGVRVVRNRIEVDADGRARAVPTGAEEIIECGLVLRSIGYRGRPVDEVPFDERRGLIPNERGRVLGPDGVVLPGEYAVGWIKRGPTGIIGTNRKDATETVAQILADAESGVLNKPRLDADWPAFPGLVDWTGWQAIDRHETAAGRPLGRPRVKLVDHQKLLDASRAAEPE